MDNATRDVRVKEVLENLQALCVVYSKVAGAGMTKDTKETKDDALDIGKLMPFM